MKKNKKSFLINDNENKKYNALNVISSMLLIGLFVLFVVTTIDCIIDMAKSTDKMQYLVPLLQRLSSVVIIWIPFLLKKIWGIVFPCWAVICFYVFMFLSAYLGVFLGLYKNFTVYDKIVHFLSGFVLTFLAMFIFRAYTKNSDKFSGLFLFLFLISFSIMVGAFWEIWEFTCDSIFKTTMQGFSGLSGQKALFDTMFALIADSLGALIGTIICFVCCKKCKNFGRCFDVEKIKKSKQEKQKIKEMEDIEEVEE